MTVTLYSTIFRFIPLKFSYILYAPSEVLFPDGNLILSPNDKMCI